MWTNTTWKSQITELNEGNSVWQLFPRHILLFSESNCFPILKPTDSMNSEKRISLWTLHSHHCLLVSLFEPMDPIRSALCLEFTIYFKGHHQPQSTISNPPVLLDLSSTEKDVSMWVFFLNGTVYIPSWDLGVYTMHLSQYEYFFAMVQYISLVGCIHYAPPWNALNL